MIGSPLTGVVIPFVIPLFFGGFGPSEGHFKAGLNWYEQGRFENAIEEYGKAIELKPDFARAYVKRSEAWFATGNRAQALWDYNDAISYEKQMILKIATGEYQNYKAALAQGYSQKASIEATRAKELGYDPILIEASFGRSLP